MSFKKVLTLSILFHAMFIFILIEAHSSCEKDEPQQVFEVTIMSGIAEGNSNGKGSGGMTQGRNIVMTEPAQAISLGAVEKERPVQDPDLHPSQMDTDSKVTKGPAGVVSGMPGNAHAPKGSFYEINLWKSRVQNLVEAGMQDPSGKKKLDISRQTTCLLGVSRTGELLKQQLLESSGDRLLDSLVQTSLGTVGQLPPPPMVLINGSDSIEVTMSFTYPQSTP